jgi:hypothetical protein
VERFRGPGGYTDPSVELREQPLSFHWDDLEVRYPGKADEFSGTPSCVAQFVVLDQLSRAQYDVRGLRWGRWPEWQMPLVREYVQPLPALQMARAHYFNVIPHWVTPAEHGDAATYRHINFLPYFFRYLVRRWRILITLNGADALGRLDIDQELAMTRHYYDYEHDRLVQTIAAQLFLPRSTERAGRPYEFFITDMALTGSEDSSTDDDSWMQLSE